MLPMIQRRAITQVIRSGTEKLLRKENQQFWMSFVRPRGTTVVMPDG